MKNNVFKKFGKIIFKNRTLRVLSSLCIIFIISALIFFFIYFSYTEKIENNELKIDQAQQTLFNLEYLVTLEENGDLENKIDNSLFAQKSFVGYEEVIPFIAMLESLFTIIDPKAEINIKSKEEQIFISHFADYAISLKINNKNLFFKALDELYNSRFIAKLTNFTMHYKTIDKNTENELSEVEFVIRLYLN